jgi:O-antigen biosynthesis protein WbqP
LPINIVSRLVAFVLLLVTLPFFFVLSILIFVVDGSPIFYFQKRVGYKNSYFQLIKFRTMKNGTPNVATHLVQNPEKHYIKFGKFIRKLSFDEIPQLLNIIFGDMVFVGPRPALYNQYDLIELRNEYKIYDILPGITGWAQVNGRDELSISKKVEYDFFYRNKKSIFFDIKIIYMTIFSVLLQKGIEH